MCAPIVLLLVSRGLHMLMDGKPPEGAEQCTCWLIVERTRVKGLIKKHP